MPFLTAFQPETALVRLGPGGDFVTDLRPEPNGRLRRVSASTNGSRFDGQDSAADRRHADNFERSSPARTVVSIAGSPDARDQAEVSLLALQIGTILAAERVIFEQDAVLTSAIGVLSAFSNAQPIPSLILQHVRIHQSQSVIRSLSVPLVGTYLVGTGSPSSSSFAPASQVPHAHAVPDLRSRAPGVSGGGSGVHSLSGSSAFDTQEGLNHEPHSQATPHPSVDPRLPRAAWLFADDARTRRPDRREQGHGLRARRSAHQEGRAYTRPQQGSLFVDR